MTASLLSVNIGEPTTATWAGHKGVTGIDKRPVSGAVRLAELGVEGDHVPDTQVHGGIDLTLGPELLPRLLDAPQLPQHLRDKAARRVGHDAGHASATNEPSAA